MHFRLRLAALSLATVLSAGSPSPAAEAIPRAQLLAEAKGAEPVQLPTPGKAIALPDDWGKTDTALSIELSKAPAGELSIRRVGGKDGRLYLELRSAQGTFSGTAKVSRGGQQLGQAEINESAWLSLKPKFGKLAIQVSFPEAKDPVQLTAPTTLVEVRGRQIFVNGEVFLIKGATVRGLNDADAAYVHSLGLNTLRGLNALADCEQFGFMSIASLNFGDTATTNLMRAPNAEFEQSLPASLDWLREHAAAPIASPNTLILQLGNERTGPGAVPPGAEPLSRARRHVSQLLVAARNVVKPLAPVLPVGYANQDLGYLAPDCMDVYMHNSFLAKDRYSYPWDDFLRWQGCLPPDGPGGEGRPFVNSEFGANRYLCQAYLKGPNNPVLEKIHAWNFPQRWDEFMEHGTAGGAIYCMYDLNLPLDQGCSCFGILTFDRKPKLACWEVGHMWRDFDMTVKGSDLVVSYKRDYWARECRVTLTPAEGQAVTRHLDDFAPRSTRPIPLKDFVAGDATKGVRWTIDFTTHSGLVNKAAGAWPAEFEEREFLNRMKGRETYPFVSELFDAEILTVDGKPAPRTLAEMTNSDGIIPVALRKRNGVTYLLLIARENPNDHGQLREGVTIDVAFKGVVTKVNDMTGEPLPGNVNAAPTPNGQRLTNVQAARIPGPIGARSATAFMLPIYRISP